LKKKLSKNIHKKALILGTGGSAKAVEFVLAKLGINSKIVSRKPSARSFSYEQVTPEVIRDHKLIINSTPLGMFPNVVQAPDLPYTALTKDHFLFDLIYNPEKTLFLKKGEAQGAVVENGYRMLELQAEENWKIWNS
jgi:shikimate dehydrogenase